jgi:hypothetical protein
MDDPAPWVHHVESFGEAGNEHLAAGDRVDDVGGLGPRCGRRPESVQDMAGLIHPDPDRGRFAQRRPRALGGGLREISLEDHGVLRLQVEHPGGRVATEMEPEATGKRPPPHEGSSRVEVGDPTLPSVEDEDPEG